MSEIKQERDDDLIKTEEGLIFNPYLGWCRKTIPPAVAPANIADQ